MRVLFINEVCEHTGTGKYVPRNPNNCMIKEMMLIVYERNGSVPGKYRKFAIRIGNDLSEKSHSTADVLINPTYEDNYPTINLEAEVCVCLAIIYDASGSRETLRDKRSKDVPVGSMSQIIESIETIKGEIVRKALSRQMQLQDILLEKQNTNNTMWLNNKNTKFSDGLGGILEQKIKSCFTIFVDPGYQVYGGCAA